MLYSLKLHKFKQISKGIEETKVNSIIPLENVLAVEMTQRNCLTIIVFIDKRSADVYGIYHYQREVKSGFIKLR